MNIYFCRVIHERYVKPLYQFNYHLAYLYFDIDQYFFINTTRFLGGLLSLRASDYGFRNTQYSVRDWVEDHLSNHALNKPAKIFLFTLPRLFNFGFNPINIYFCFDNNQYCYAKICEVNNTFGQKTAYVLQHNHTDNIEKNLHVSPFFDLNKHYQFNIDVPDVQCRTKIKLIQTEQTQFQAILWGKQTPATPFYFAKILLTMPLMTLKVMAAIHWQALKLALRGAKFHRNPHPDGNYELPIKKPQQ